MKNKILLVLGSLGLVSMGLLGGFMLGESSTYRIDPETSRVIEKRYFYFTGQVSEIDPANNAVTLFTGGDSAKIEIKKDTPVTSYAFRPDDKTPNEQPKIVEFKDILVGDKVSIYAEVQSDGKPLGTSVYIHFVPVRAI